MINLEARIPAKHPIRRIKGMVDEILDGMDAYFDERYEELGRASVPPERLLKAKVLMAPYVVRSDRQFCERLNYDLLFQWFLDMNPSEPAFHATVFSKNMNRLLEHHSSELFFSEVVELARRHQWVSHEHFRVDGTLIEAWASMKNFRPKGGDSDDGNGWQDFKGKKRGNETHESRTELEQALRQVDELSQRGFDPRSVGADRGYHTKNFMRGCRERGIAPHVAAHPRRRTPGLDGRTRRGGAYQASQKVRKRIEEIFGWSKTTGAFRKTRYHGVERTGFCAHFVAAACNLVRMAKLMEASPPNLAEA